MHIAHPSGAPKASADDEGAESATAMISITRGPYFDKVASKNVTALVGKTAYLNCRVRNLGNRSVSILKI